MIKRLHEKKGQAAMEFLMTYGWAILAAIIAIGVLAYFGVFSPGKLVSGQAVVNAPFFADAFNIDDDLDDAGANANDGFNIEITQNSGKTIDIGTSGSMIITFTQGGTSGGTCNDTTALPTAWSTGAKETFVFDCGSTSAFVEGDSVGGDIAIQYTITGSTLVQASTGTVRGVVTAI